MVGILPKKQFGPVANKAAVQVDTSQVRIR